MKNFIKKRKKTAFLAENLSNDVLLETRELYFINFNSWDTIEIDNHKLNTTSIIGRPGHKQGYGHNFAEDTRYKLEIINDQINPEFHDVGSIFHRQTGIK